MESLSEQGIPGAEHSYVLNDHENHHAGNYRSGHCQVPQEIEDEPVSGEKDDYCRDHGPRALENAAKYFHGVGSLNQWALKIRSMEQLRAHSPCRRFPPDRSAQDSNLPH